MTGILVFLAWFFFSFVIAQYADNKGRSPVGWLFISLVFSPIIAWLILLATPKRAGKIEARAITSGEYKRCPNCAELVRSAAIKCRHCGSELPKQAIPTT